MALPDLNLLLALDVLLEEGSVIGAARRMHLSPPAMSRTLGRIRDTLGDPIFLQVGRKLVPTARALALREQVRGLVEQATHVLAPDTVIDLTTLERRFNVRATDEFLSVHLGRLLEAMRTEMPRATLRLIAEEDDVDEEALRSGRIDLFVSASRELGNDIQIEQLFTTTFVGVAREQHPIFKSDVTLERLTQWEHINISRRGKSVGPIDSALQAQGLRRHVSLVVSSPYVALFALMNSDLLLPLPRHLARSALEARLPIRLFELPATLETVPLIQAWHPRLDQDPAHQWLRRNIQRLCMDDESLARR